MAAGANPSAQTNILNQEAVIIAEQTTLLNHNPKANMLIDRLKVHEPEGTYRKFIITSRVEILKVETRKGRNITPRYRGDNVGFKVYEMITNDNDNLCSIKTPGRVFKPTL
jgi:hypothetical protein